MSRCSFTNAMLELYTVSATCDCSASVLLRGAGVALGGVGLSCALAIKTPSTEKDSSDDDASFHNRLSPFIPYPFFSLAFAVFPFPLLSICRFSLVRISSRVSTARRTCGMVIEPPTIRITLNVSKNSSSVTPWSAH